MGMAREQEKERAPAAELKAVGPPIEHEVEDGHMEVFRHNTSGTRFVQSDER